MLFDSALDGHYNRCGVYGKYNMCGLGKADKFAKELLRTHLAGRKG